MFPGTGETDRRVKCLRTLSAPGLAGRFLSYWWSTRKHCAAVDLNFSVHLLKASRWLPCLGRCEKAANHSCQSIHMDMNFIQLLSGHCQRVCDFFLPSVTLRTDCYIQYINNMLVDSEEKLVFIYLWTLTRKYPKKHCA